MTGHHRWPPPRMNVSSSKLYIATFNGGEIEEKFYAGNYEHAHNVAHEIAARRQIKFDALKQLSGEED